MVNSQFSYQYSHIFSIESEIFIERLLNAFRDNSLLFQKQKHVVIIPFLELVEKLTSKGYSNIVYIPNDNIVDSKYINNICKISRWVFIHGMPPISNAIFIKNIYLKKIIWRTWGHDVGYDLSIYESINFKNIIRRLIQRIWRHKVRRMKLIGVANIVDIVDIEERFGQGLQICYIHYSLSKSENNISLEKPAISNEINIMVGHSGHENDNHISVLQSLEHLKGNNIHLYIPLAYGKEKYIYDVKSYLENNWTPDKYTIQENILPASEYFSILNKMDCAILDGIKSYALGNINILLRFNKKIFLNQSGILHKVFDNLGIYHGITSSLGNISLEELTSSKPVEESVLEQFKPKCYETYVNRWNELLYYLS